MFILHKTPQTLLFSKESMASFAISTASRICSPSTKVFCDYEITLPTANSSLLAKTFARTLYELPTKLIGLKSLRSSVPPFFGINTKKGALRLFSNLPYHKIL